MKKYLVIFTSRKNKRQREEEKRGVKLTNSHQINYGNVSDLRVFPEVEPPPRPSSEAKSSKPKSTLEARPGPRSSKSLRSRARLLEAEEPRCCWSWSSMMSRLRSKYSDESSHLTLYHQSQTRCSWLKIVPRGQRNEDCLFPSSQTWNT